MAQSAFKSKFRDHTNHSRIRYVIDSVDSRLLSVLLALIVICTRAYCQLYSRLLTVLIRAYCQLDSRLWARAFERVALIDNSHYGAGNSDGAVAINNLPIWLG